MIDNRTRTLEDTKRDAERITKRRLIEDAEENGLDLPGLGIKNSADDGNPEADGTNPIPPTGHQEPEPVEQVAAEPKDPQPAENF